MNYAKEFLRIVCIVLLVIVLSPFLLWQALSPLLCRLGWHLVNGPPRLDNAHKVLTGRNRTVRSCSCGAKTRVGKEFE